MHRIQREEIRVEPRKKGGTWGLWENPLGDLFEGTKTTFPQPRKEKGKYRKTPWVNAVSWFGKCWNRALGVVVPLIRVFTHGKGLEGK